MSVYSTASPVVSAVIVTCGENGAEDVVTNVAKGDTLSNIVLAPNYAYAPAGADIEIASATVLGFRLGALDIPRGVTRVYDGIPTYYQDPDGNGNHGLVEEVMCVKSMLVEIPAEEEGANPTTMNIKIERIKSIGGSSSSSDEGSDEGTEDTGETA